MLWYNDWFWMNELYRYKLSPRLFVHSPNSQKNNLVWSCCNAGGSKSAVSKLWWCCYERFWTAKSVLKTLVACPWTIVGGSRKLVACCLSLFANPWFLETGLWLLWAFWTWNIYDWISSNRQACSRYSSKDLLTNWWSRTFRGPIIDLLVFHLV